MGKQKLNIKDLLAITFLSEVAKSLSLNIMNRHYKHTTNAEKLYLITKVLTEPESLSSQNDHAFYVSKKYSSEAIHIIKSCELEAETLLQRNKLLLLKVAEYLTVNSKMNADMIEAYARQYAAEEWVVTEGFIKKDAYYKFNTKLQDQLSKIDHSHRHAPPAFASTSLTL